MLIKGFPLLGVRDLLPPSSPKRNEKHSRAHNEIRVQFFLSELEKYLEGRNNQVKEICLKYLLEDCEREIEKARNKKSVLEFLNALKQHLQPPYRWQPEASLGKVKRVEAHKRRK